MSLLSTYVCDQCGKQKETSNHWWIAFVETGLGIWNWDETRAQSKSSIHLCGEGCAAKLMSQWMETTSKATT